jgi:hypothetical protein
MYAFGGLKDSLSNASLRISDFGFKTASLAAIKARKKGCQVIGKITLLNIPEEE